MTVACILVAAGRGERLGDSRPKAFAEVGGHPLLWHAVQAVSRSTTVSHVVAVVPAGYEDHAGRLLPPGVGSVVVGGDTRQSSVARGLAALPPEVEVVLVHDAARCLAPSELHDAVAAHVSNGRDAVVPGLAVVDTLKQVDGAGRVTATADRSRLRAVQTPQGFRRAVLARAHDAGTERGDTDAPDDGWLVEQLGVAVHVVPGHEDAFKITRAQDLLLAEAVLARRMSATTAPA